MATISLTLPVAGTVITAGLHATNYTAISGAINGGLDTANWASGLIFAPSKFMQEGATRRDGLLWNGTNWVPAGVAGVYDRATTTVDVQNSAAETSIYSKQIAANDMGTNKALWLTLVGDYLHNNVAGDTLIWRIKFGGTTLYQSNASALGTVTGANRRPWRISLILANLGATNSQMLEAILDSQAMSANAPTTGIGTVAVDNFAAGHAGISTLAAIDTTANQTLDVTMQWSAASANNSWRMRYGVLQIV